MRTTIAAAVFSLTGLPAMAAGLLYDCDITNRQAKVDWISPKLAIIVQADGSVLAHDNITLHFYGKPVPTKARKRGDMMILRWDLKGVSDSNNQKVPAFQYEARLNTKTNVVRYSASPSDTPQRWTGQGKCTPRKK